MINKTKKIVESIGKENLILISFILCVVIISGLYTTFSLSTVSEGISIVDGVKTMKFILGEKEENTITIASGSRKNIAVTVTNNDEIPLKYGIYYETSDALEDVELGYQHSTENLPNGTINSKETKVVTIQVENNSSELKTITFGLVYGLEKGGDLIIEENQKFLEQKLNFPLNEVEKGSYVEYKGNNGCTEEQCIGNNANDPENQTGGYCGNNTEKYKDTGWRIAYTRNDTAYITAAGAPECIKQEEKIESLSKALNETALNYCNIDYAYHGVCNEKTAWSINTNDFHQITNKKLHEVLCLEKENKKECGYQNNLIDIGSTYWLINMKNNSLLYYQPNPMHFENKELTNEKGIRPILKLDSTVIVIGGTGTKDDPYKIKNTSVPNYEYTIVYNGNGATSGDTEDSIHKTNELKKLNKNNFELAYETKLSEFATFDDSYCEENGTCHNASIIPNKEQKAEFLGWSTNKDDKEAKYSDEQEVINLSTSSSEIIINLYAIWKYSALELPSIQEREGYDILGWYTEKTGGEKVGNPGDEYTNTNKITLYARWQKKSS